ncbi:hypothetical protein F4777DRAFT_544236 [Nemania sp. FL0916]|nr:hypothetical protein F4777DRAFT_544236 [Nemania sp. FL0916]
MQPAHVQPDPGPLEDHLRGLILTNSAPEAAPSSESHSSAAVIDTLQTKSESLSSHGHSDVGRPASKGSRKRPNQAQRRQMNAELTLSIDANGPAHPSSQQYTHLPAHMNPRLPQHGQHQIHSEHAPAYSSHSLDRPMSNSKQSYGQYRPNQAHFSTPPSYHQSDWRRQERANLNTRSRGANIVSTDTFPSRGGRYSIQPQAALYNPGGHQQIGPTPEQLATQSAYLDQLSHQIVLGAEIGPDEITEKETFRRHVEAICRAAIAGHENEANGACDFPPQTVELKCFGSLASGFATKAADMDLGLLSPASQLSPGSPGSPIPRLIEGALLSAGFGARLLTKTRVSIIKLCEKPDISLRQNLLDARVKWENGVEDEPEPEDEVLEDPDILPDIDFPADTEPNQANAKVSAPQPPPSVQAAPSQEEELSSLRQARNQPLTNYYNNAKRILRRLNGRDIKQSNCQDFTETDFILLDKVACAFVMGLHNPDLRSRILAYPSFHIGDTTQLPNYRSLFGILTMIEGERLVLSWEMMQSSLSHSKTDPPQERAVRQWRDLQYSKNFGTNPVWFNKELQLAIEGLCKIPYVQVTHLQQEQYESPTQYYDRTNKIAIAVSGTPLFSGPDTRSRLIKHYVAGIRNEEIRKHTRDFVDFTGTESLRSVARKHKSLHLAADYERAIKHGCYQPDHLPVLQRYITILRRRPMPSTRPSTNSEYLIPIMRDEIGVLEVIRELPNPSALNPNKPRDRYNDSLEFPKSGVGVQCDINFSAYLALQNTSLLRCYSLTDPRVRPLVLFVKHWAKARDINTPYRGTLSSYGYVLMVLHFLVNVVEPFVCPNLQALAPSGPDVEGVTTCQGCNIRFWRDEQAIQNLAMQGQLNQNRDSVGTLLNGFFEYYAQSNMMITYPKRGFDWGRDVISPRTHGGLLSKVEKGWTGAKTIMQPQGGALITHPKANEAPSSDGAAQLAAEQQAPKLKDLKEVRHRFLMAIEDPFELDHNVARTVTHQGIVSIRDEFRRAWRIIKVAGKGQAPEALTEDVKMRKEELEKKQFVALLDGIHGNEVFSKLEIP